MVRLTLFLHFFLVESPQVWLFKKKRVPHYLQSKGGTELELVSVWPSVREAPSLIPGEIISLFQLLFFLCSFD